MSQPTIDNNQVKTDASTTSVPRVEIELPADHTATPLPAEEHSHVLDPHSGEALTEATRKPIGDGNHILCCLDPDANRGQSDVALAAAKRLVKAGDTLVLFSVMAPIIVSDPGAYGDIAGGYDTEWQLQALRNMRKVRISELVAIAKTMPKDVKLLVHVVHGGTERKILAAAEQHHCYLIILGRRKLGRFEKWLSTSVSSWVVSHAPCDVLVAK